MLLVQINININKAVLNAKFKGDEEILTNITSSIELFIPNKDNISLKNQQV